LPLPKLNTKEWDNEVKLYKQSTAQWRDTRAAELGYLDRSGYQTVMARRGVRLESNIPDPQPETVVFNLPKINLKKYLPIKHGRNGDPETACLQLTDHHNGQLTVSYNSEVYQIRLEHLFQSVMRIVTLHRNMYPVNDLVILITGDMVHGENSKQGGKVGGISMGAREQISDSLHKLSEFILSLKQNFVTVECYCVPGNHGRYFREAPATSNWDILLYDQLKINLGHYNVKVNVSNTFYAIPIIQDKKFFIFHGDQFRAIQGIPWFAMTKGLQSWWVTYGGFDYAVAGHFHSDHIMRLNSKSKLIMGGSLSTDDTFTQEIVKTSSIPSQWLWGVHKDKGLTWSYSLIVDDKYF